MRIIAGPCQHESFDQSMEIASACQRICDVHGIEYIFKASYDKANRTSANSKRGIGLEATFTDFYSMKKEMNVKILTDVHDITQVNEINNWYLKCVDVLQIPAFLCRQTDLILAACNTRKIVNIKKGQFLAPWDVKGILSKTGDDEVWITERGTSFGYNNLVVDFTGLSYMLDNYSVPIFLDCTHSVQKPGGLGESSGGNRNYVAPLSRAASALGINNFFMEVHPNPDNAPSDGPNMVYLKDFEQIVNNIVRYNYDCRKSLG